MKWAFGKKVLWFLLTIQHLFVLSGPLVLTKKKKEILFESFFFPRLNNSNCFALRGKHAHLQHLQERCLKWEAELPQLLSAFEKECMKMSNQIIVKLTWQRQWACGCITCRAILHKYTLLYVSLTVSLTVFQEMEDKVLSPEKAEEAKLKARYPHLGQKPGGSDFLRKRLQKGVSYCLQGIDK